LLGIKDRAGFLPLRQSAVKLAGASEIQPERGSGGEITGFEPKESLPNE